MDAMTKKAWERGFEKRLVADSLFGGQLSNRVDIKTPLTNGMKMSKLPDSCVINVTDDYKKGVFSTLIPMMDKLSGEPQGGQEPSEGEEETPQLRYAEQFYNVRRKSWTLKDLSVDGDLTEAYDIGMQSKELGSDYFVELDDWCSQRALIEKADIFLTETKYWTGPAKSTPPVSKALHSRMYATDAAAKVTWNATYSTYEASLETALAALAPASVMDLAALNQLVVLANRHCKSLKGWRTGDKRIRGVIALSEYQCEQILDSASPSFRDLAAAAEQRGVENRAISNILGYWRGYLLVGDARSPVYDHSKAAGSRFVYHTPMAEPTHTVHGNGAATGTCEIARVLCRGALGRAVIRMPKFNQRQWDYGFREGMNISMSAGDMRLEFGQGDSAEPIQQGSLLYFTATPSAPA